MHIVFVFIITVICPLFLKQNFETCTHCHTKEVDLFHGLQNHPSHFLLSDSKVAMDAVSLSVPHSLHDSR